MVLIARTRTGHKLHIGGLGGQDQGITSACGVDLMGDDLEEDEQADLDKEWLYHPENCCLRCEIAYDGIMARAKED